MAGQIPDFARPKRRRERRPPNRGRRPGQLRPYRVAEFISAYVSALVITLGGFALLNILFVPFYFVIGVVLTRYISQRVIWNYYIASLADVARAKTHMWLTWPISVPMLIWQIVVAEHL